MLWGTHVAASVPVTYECMCMTRVRLDISCDHQRASSWHCTYRICSTQIATPFQSATLFLSDVFRIHRGGSLLWREVHFPVNNTAEVTGDNVPVSPPQNLSNSSNTFCDFGIIVGNILGNYETIRHKSSEVGDVAQAKGFLCNLFVVTNVGDRP